MNALLTKNSTKLNDKDNNAGSRQERNPSKEKDKIHTNPPMYITTMI